MDRAISCLLIISTISKKTKITKWMSISTPMIMKVSLSLSFLLKKNGAEKNSGQLKEEAKLKNHNLFGNSRI
jgi:hypothetical protein